MRKQWLLANWKMHGSRESVALLLNHLLTELSITEVSSCVLFPPAVFLQQVMNVVHGTSLRFGAQNVYPAVQGAFTGEISGPMLREFFCDFVLVGHSERRHVFGENNYIIAKKFHHVLEHDMIPVLCVGETAEDRSQYRTRTVLQEQLCAIASAEKNKPFIVAYEPVWAIGTGDAATPEHVVAVHAEIRDILSQYLIDVESVPVVYGGSVKQHNAAEFTSCAGVDGLLVGGASLIVDEFIGIAKCIK